MYFNIQRFSTHDGDGIRSILFLKGCSLNCSWCQNPESLYRKRSLMFDERSCLTDCNLCEQGCPAIQREGGTLKIDRPAIKQDQLIALESICPTKALTVCGKEANADELFDLLMRDKAFYDQSNGGVTFSGGEPLMQPDLVENLASRLQAEGVSCAMESCLHAPWKYIERIAPFIDCWLVDLKHTDEHKFKAWTKGSLSLIEANFRKLARIARRIVIRVPVIPDFNDTDDELKSIIDFAESLENCRELHLLAYHTLGMSKYHLLGLPYQCSESPLNKPELLQNAQAYGHKHTKLKVTLGG
ncbi:glycyl-radical enzyme activating protein [Endozoicomonas gorgoniicola]|uniref:Glycyl-radical enzyme activating protein n=1 Tax=Endozoicomonas gorgoniicola TaxID=1234144 RepID=A0ABT3N3L1_9GAMM|nr:glycyl-radical enzyme activating protein [Endozoicomonas gorgoniicola]MCW7556220.1 glycyl-radical enzyme activating protein [Endozoicomonas gorgoniicola]